MRGSRLHQGIIDDRRPVPRTSFGTLEHEHISGCDGVRSLATVCQEACGHAQHARLAASGYGFLPIAADANRLGAMKELSPVVQAVETAVSMSLVESLDWWILPRQSSPALSNMRGNQRRCSWTGAPASNSDTKV
jgi:hypothetical protein